MMIWLMTGILDSLNLQRRKQKRLMVIGAGGVAEGGTGGGGEEGISDVDGYGSCMSYEKFEVLTIKIVIGIDDYSWIL